jgi:hypothetical protein
MKPIKVVSTMLVGALIVFAFCYGCYHMAAASYVPLNFGGGW